MLTSADSVTSRHLLFFLPSPCWLSPIIVSNVNSFYQIWQHQTLPSCSLGTHGQAMMQTSVLAGITLIISANGVLGPSVSPSFHVTPELCWGEGNQRAFWWMKTKFSVIANSFLFYFILFSSFIETCIDKCTFDYTLEIFIIKYRGTCHLFILTFVLKYHLIRRRPHLDPENGEGLEWSSHRTEE